MRNPFLRPDQSSASFLPQEYVARKNEMRANLFCLGLFGVVMFGVVSAFFVTNRQWLHVRDQQRAMTMLQTKEAAKIEQYKRLEEQKSDMMRKAEITTALVEKVPRSKLISEIVTRMPKDITLLEVNLVSKRIKETPASSGFLGVGGASAPPKGQIKTLGGKPPSNVAGAKAPTAPPKADEPKVSAPRFEFTIKLTGVARVNTDVADYLQSLKSCAGLDNVDLKYIKETTVEKLELRKFEIEATIRKEADLRGLEAIDLRTATAGGVVGADPKRSAGSGGATTVNVTDKADGSASVNVTEKKED
jgi:Tfp pilus assembly protein PilN